MTRTRELEPGSFWVTKSEEGSSVILEQWTGTPKNVSAANILLEMTQPELWAAGYRVMTLEPIPGKLGQTEIVLEHRIEEMEDVLFPSSLYNGDIPDDQELKQGEDDIPF